MTFIHGDIDSKILISLLFWIKGPKAKESQSQAWVYMHMTNTSIYPHSDLKQGSRQKCIHRIENCIHKIHVWCVLILWIWKMKQEKKIFSLQKLIMFGTWWRLSQIDNIKTTMVHTVISSSSVRNLSFHLDEHINNTAHINWVAICTKLSETAAKLEAFLMSTLPRL